MSSAALWHQVECAGYAADLPVWDRLAETAEGSLLELGCGSGRVALRLARLGYRVCGVDRDPELVASLATAAASQELPMEAIHADVTRLSLDREFALILAPMQLLQAIGGRAARDAAFRRAAAHLRAGDRLAAAIVDGVPRELPAPGPPLADIREANGWIYSSLPLAVEVADGRLRVRRLRQIVSPNGDLSEDEHTDLLELIDAGSLEGEASAAGLRPAARLPVPPGDGHIGSTVVVLEKA
jgi:SAM-dependent methyltransferase